MELMDRLNSPFMYIVCGSVIAFIAVVCLVFLVRAYRAGIAMGMERSRLRKVIINSASFTVLPAFAILLGVIALSGSLGVPWPWLRLSVIGALHYETQVASAAAEATGMSSLSAAEMTAGSFSTICLLMSVCIIWEPILCVFFTRRYSGRLGAADEKEARKSTDLKAARNDTDLKAARNDTDPKAARNDTDPKTARNDTDLKAARNDTDPKAARNDTIRSRGFGDLAVTAMFIGLVTAYIGSYIGEAVSGNGLLGFGGNRLPLAVAAVAAVSMAFFMWLKDRKNLEWVDSFSVCGSMLAAMAAAMILAPLL